MVVASPHDNLRPPCLAGSAQISMFACLHLRGFTEVPCVHLCLNLYS